MQEVVSDIEETVDEIVKLRKKASIIRRDLKALLGLIEFDALNRLERFEELMDDPCNTILDCVDDMQEAIQLLPSKFE